MISKAELARPPDGLLPACTARRTDGETFLPTLAAAQAGIAAVRPAADARTRNALDGAVSGLSPYISHGFGTLADVLADVLAGVASRHALDRQHQLVFGSAADLLAASEVPAR